MSIAHQSWESGSSHSLACKMGAKSCDLCKEAGSGHRGFMSHGLPSLSLFSSADSKPEEEDEKCFLQPATAFSGKSSLTCRSLQLEATKVQGLVHQSDACLLDDYLTSQAEDTLRKAPQNDESDQLIYPGSVGVDAIHRHSVPPMPLHILGSKAQRGNSCEEAGASWLGSNDRSRSSSPSSSIGVCENSSSTSNEALMMGNTEEEVQSTLRGPLEDLNSLEESLPLRKGLSRFISGKSRSFSCLSDVRSVKELAKPENPYSRRRRFNFHRSEGFDRHRYLPPRNSTVGISKKSICSSKINLSLALAYSTEVTGTNVGDWDCCGSFNRCSNRLISSRSLSMTDLQRVAGRVHFLIN
ncbi:hypothetical protein O6H91_Y226000 [Diphasiastrum complanatum]|nr:hypothetical protein O6H91_Y226000 [Diphasiastrum complanatum]